MRLATDLFPHGGPGRRWLYLLGFHDGRVKIGSTSKPRQRMRQHRQMHGVASLAWAHLFWGASFASANVYEHSVKQAFSQVGQRIGNTEIFRGISREVALAIAREIIQECRPYDFAKISARKYQRSLKASPA